MIEEKNLSESQIQSQIYQWYNNKYCLKHHLPRCLIFAVPNGGTRNKLEAITLKSTGLLPGVSDLILVHARANQNMPAGIVAAKRSILAFVEVKTDSGRQSTDQIEFEARVTALGFIYQLVRSLDEFKGFVAQLDQI